MHVCVSVCVCVYVCAFILVICNLCFMCLFDMLMLYQVREDEPSEEEKRKMDLQDVRKRER